MPRGLKGYLYQGSSLYHTEKPPEHDKGPQVVTAARSGVCPTSLPIVVIWLLSCVQPFGTPRAIAHQAPLSSTICQSLLRFMSIESVMLSNHPILFCPLLLPSIFPSIRVFSSESALYIRWPKYWSFCFSISPSSEYSRLISLRIDWFDLTVQETLESLFQQHNSKASILRHSAFFKRQLSHLYMTIGKTIALTIRTFVGKVMSLLFNMLFRFVTAQGILLSIL